MDKQYSVQFFTKFVEAMQKFCRDYLEFEQVVELSGYLSLEIDNYKKERYILSEMVHNTGDVISESYCVKAFKTMKRLPPRNSNSDDVLRDNTNTLRSSHEISIDLRDNTGQSSQYSIPYQMPSSRHRAQVHQAPSNRHDISNQQSFRQSMNRRNNQPSFASGGPDSNTYASSSSQIHERETIQPRQSVQYLTSAAHSSPVMAVIPSLDDADSEPDHSSITINQSSTEGVPIHVDENRGKKRSSVQEENISHKKEKLDSELESLFTAATSIATEGDATDNTTAPIDSETVPHSDQSNMNIPENNPSSTQTRSDNESLHLSESIQIKEEVDDDILFIDSPDDKAGPDLSGYGADSQSYTPQQISSAESKSLQRTSGENISISKDYEDIFSNMDSKICQHEVGIRLPSKSAEEPRVITCKTLKREVVVLKMGTQQYLKDNDFKTGKSGECVSQAGSVNVPSTSSSIADQTNSTDEIRKFIYPFRKRLPTPKGGHRCELCDYRTNKLSNFKRHQRCHTGDFFQCHLCPRQFAEKLKLSYHLQGHRGELICRYCEKVFASRQGHVQHEKTCRTKKGIPCSCKH